MNKVHLDYFNKGKIDNPKYWERIGHLPDFTKKSVLDVGCGHGSLCIDVANSGAEKVLGLDLNQELIEFAKENLKENFPHLLNVVEFKCIDLSDTENVERYDYIISKDSFEHILELPKMLNEMKSRLKKGGRVFIGFGPLYYSYFGDHKRTKLVIPWAHVVIPENIIVKYLNRFHGYDIKSVRDLGLNMYKLADYERFFDESGLEVEVFKVNENRRIASKLFSLISKVPGCREICSHNVYCILRKRF